MRELQISDARSGAVLAGQAEACDSLWTRFRGLMLRATLPDGRGVVLTPCGSVHTAMMRFAIDVIFLDDQDTVVKLVRNLAPYRISFGGRKAHTTVELPAGTIARTGIRLHDKLIVTGAPAGRR